MRRDTPQFARFPLTRHQILLQRYVRTGGQVTRLLFPRHNVPEGVSLGGRTYFYLQCQGFSHTGLHFARLSVRQFCVARAVMSCQPLTAEAG